MIGMLRWNERIFQPDGGRGHDSPAPLAACLPFASSVDIELDGLEEMIRNHESATVKKTKDSV